MNILKKTTSKYYDINSLYVVMTGSIKSLSYINIPSLCYQYLPIAIRVVRLKNSRFKICKDIVTKQKYYIFRNNIAISTNRLYFANSKPLVNFLKDDLQNRKIMENGIISLEEICVFLAKMNDSFYQKVFEQMKFNFFC